jgi:hypothetical protein
LSAALPGVVRNALTAAELGHRGLIEVTYDARFAERDAIVRHSGALGR